MGVGARESAQLATPQPPRHTTHRLGQNPEATGAPAPANTSTREEKGHTHVSIQGGKDPYQYNARPTERNATSPTTSNNLLEKLAKTVTRSCLKCDHRVGSRNVCWNKLLCGERENAQGAGNAKSRSDREGPGLLGILSVIAPERLHQ